MSDIPHSSPSDRRRQFPAIETYGEATYKAPDVPTSFSDEESTIDATLWDFDAALAHVALERCCVCPLCGAIVSNDGSVMG
jgi:hypothetical protein